MKLLYFRSNKPTFGGKLLFPIYQILNWKASIFGDVKNYHKAKPIAKPIVKMILNKKSTWMAVCVFS